MKTNHTAAKQKAVTLP